MLRKEHHHDFHIIARPTQSESLYTQMVGRGLRLHPDKEKLTLIDCVGVTGRKSLCTAPTLIGLDISQLPKKRQDSMEGDLFDLPVLAERAADNPQSWIRNVEIVDLWAQEMEYNLHGVNFFRMPDGSLVCSLPDRKRLRIPCPDSLGNVILGNEEVDMQTAIDRAYMRLSTDFKDSEYIWNIEKARVWGKSPASEAQKKLIMKKCKKYGDEINFNELTKLQATQILNRVLCGGTK